MAAYSEKGEQKYLAKLLPALLQQSLPVTCRLLMWLVHGGHQEMRISDFVSELCWGKTIAAYTKP